MSTKSKSRTSINSSTKRSRMNWLRNTRSTGRRNERACHLTSRRSRYNILSYHALASLFCGVHTSPMSLTLSSALRQASTNSTPSTKNASLDSLIGMVVLLLPLRPRLPSMAHSILLTYSQTQRRSGHTIPQDSESRPSQTRTMTQKSHFRSSTNTCRYAKSDP